MKIIKNFFNKIISSYKKFNQKIFWWTYQRRIEIRKKLKYIGISIQIGINISGIIGLIMLTIKFIKILNLLLILVIFINPIILLIEHIKELINHVKNNG